MKAIATGDEVAGEFVRHAVHRVAHARLIGVEIMHAHVLRAVDGAQASGLAGLHQVTRHLGLAVDHHMPAIAVACQVQAVALAAEEQLHAVVDQALCVHALTHTGLVQQIDGHLLQHARADPAEHVVRTLALQDHGVDARLEEQLTKQQARRACANDSDLGSHGSECSCEPTWQDRSDSGGWGHVPCTRVHHAWTRVDPNCTTACRGFPSRACTAKRTE